MRFSDFFIIIFFFIFFFFSHRPSALRKHGKRLLFTLNIFTSDGGVHRHQAIVPFSLYDATTNHGAFNFTSLNTPFYNCHAFPRTLYDCIIALITRVVACRRFRLCNFWLPLVQLSYYFDMSLVSCGVVRLRMSHNEFHCRTTFSLELLFVAPLLYYELDLSLSHLLVSLFCAYKILYPYTT